MRSLAALVLGVVFAVAIGYFAAVVTSEAPPPTRDTEIQD